ncbi:MAG: hypothetical protein K0S12_1217, partial [Bacteroidetes bacterium]|nr:hypothetical protein [Bacteroidota bacterium]
VAKKDKQLKCREVVYSEDPEKRVKRCDAEEIVRIGNNVLVRIHEKAVPVGSEVSFCPLIIVFDD